MKHTQKVRDSLRGITQNMPSEFEREIELFLMNEETGEEEQWFVNVVSDYDDGYWRKIETYGFEFVEAVAEECRMKGQKIVGDPEDDEFLWKNWDVLYSYFEADMPVRVSFWKEVDGEWKCHDENGTQMEEYSPRMIIDVVEDFVDYFVDRIEGE